MMTISLVSERGDGIGEEMVAVEAVDGVGESVRSMTSELDPSTLPSHFWGVDRYSNWEMSVGLLMQGTHDPSLEKEIDEVSADSADPKIFWINLYLYTKYE